MIYLASESPRRRELLEQLGVKYQSLSVVVDETADAGEAPEAYVQRLALAKAEAGCQSINPVQHAQPVLAADTIVVVDGMTLGKPRDCADAVAMLQALSGRSHQVLTAIVLLGSQRWTALSTSTVRFRELTLAECRAYWLTGEPADKAGAYAIQGRAAMFISHLSGSYSGVMGLPLFETAALLRGAGLLS